MNIKGLVNTIQEPRYDTQVATTGVPSLLYFQNGVGSQQIGAFGAATQPKTLADTNMRTSGLLPAGYAFEVKGFRLCFPTNVVYADITTILNGCVFQFVIGDRPFLTTRALNIPAGNGLFGFYTQAVAATSALITNGYPSMSNVFGVSAEPLYLEAMEQWYVQLLWPSTAGAPTVAQTGYQPSPGLPITIQLDGYLGRPVQ